MNPPRSKQRRCIVPVLQTRHHQNINQVIRLTENALTTNQPGNFDHQYWKNEETL